MVLIRIKSNRCPLSLEEKKQIEKNNKNNEDNKNKQLKCSFWSWIPPWYFDNVCDDKYTKGIKYMIYLFIISIFMTFTFFLTFLFSWIMVIVIIYGTKELEFKAAIFVLNVVSRISIFFGCIFALIAIVMFVIFAIISLIYFALHMIFGNIILLVPAFCVCCSMGIFDVYKKFFLLIPFIQVPGAFLVSTAALTKIYLVQVLGKEINDENNATENKQLSDEIGNMIQNNNEDLNIKLCPETIKEIKSYVSNFNPPVSLKFETNSDDTIQANQKPNVFTPPTSTLRKIEHDNCILKYGGYIDDSTVDNQTACFLNSLMDISCRIPFENISIHNTRSECPIVENTNIDDIVTGFDNMWKDNKNNLNEFENNRLEENSDAISKNDSSMESIVNKKT